VNRQNSTAAFTFSVHATGNDGSTLEFHENAHVSATGVAVAFDKMTCG